MSSSCYCTIASDTWLSFDGRQLMNASCLPLSVPASSIWTHFGLFPYYFLQIGEVRGDIFRIWRMPRLLPPSIRRRLIAVGCSQSVSPQWPCMDPDGKVQRCDAACSGSTSMTTIEDPVKRCDAPWAQDIMAQKPVEWFACLGGRARRFPYYNCRKVRDCGFVLFVGSCGFMTMKHLSLGLLTFRSHRPRNWSPATQP